MKHSSTSRAEISVSLFLMAVCAVVLWESRGIPPGTFEPLGSAPIPQATAIVIILLCAITVTRAFRHISREQSRSPTVGKRIDQDVELEYAHQPQHKTALIVLALTIMYGLVLHSKAVSFALATVVFLFFTMGLLVRFEPRSMVTVAIIAIVMSFGSQYVFTKVFVVDLPGAF